jgi:uridine phosphorylase
MNNKSLDERLPHLLAYPGDLSPYAIVVGDAQRVKKAEALMEKVRVVGDNRGYLTITGIYKEQDVTVASHGIGAAGANLCFMELIHGGVKTLIRAGTCGALDRKIDDGEFIITTGAIREDGATDQLMPIGYPAIADFQVINALLKAAYSQGYDNPHIGLSVSYANFYPSPVLPPPYKRYLGYGAKALEMELAGLLVVALMLGARAGGILVSDGNMIRGGNTVIDEFRFNPHREEVEAGVLIMLRIALEALVDLAHG